MRVLRTWLLRNREGPRSDRTFGIEGERLSCVTRIAARDDRADEAIAE
jgi:hypothetical protein